MVGAANDSVAPVAGFAILIAVWFVVVLGSLAMTVVAIVDIARRPDWQWKLAGQEKVLWLLLVILVNILAVTSLIYWFAVRPKLVEVEATARAGALGPGHMTYAGWTPGPAVPLCSAAPPGWHPDPSGAPRLRWWDGVRWSEHTWEGSPRTP